MKILKTSFLCVVASALLFSSCSQDDDIDITTSDKLIEKTFNVGTASPQSRAAINDFNSNESTVEIGWTTKDIVSVFAVGHEESSPFTFTGIMGNFNTQGFFTGKTHDVQEYYALYPHQSDATLDNNKKLHVTIPSSQRAIHGTFDPAAGLQMGKASSTGEITLGNLCAYFYITVDKECSGIEMETVDNSNWYLAGKVTASTSSGSAKIEGFDDCTNKITMTGLPDAGVSTKGTYFIAFIPTSGVDATSGTKSPQFKITLKGLRGNNKNISFKTMEGASYVAGHFYNLGTYTYQ